MTLTLSQPFTLATPAASSTHFISVAFRFKWRRSEHRRITSEQCWRGLNQSTSRRHTAFRLGALPRISWKSSPFAPENCSRSGLIVENLIKRTVSLGPRGTFVYSFLSSIRLRCKSLLTLRQWKTFNFNVG